MSTGIATLVAIAAGGVGVFGLARSRAHIPPRKPTCGTCKTTDCSGAYHHVGVHDPRRHR